MQKTFEFARPIGPYPYDPAKANQLLTEAGYPNGFDAGDLHPWPPYFSAGEREQAQEIDTTRRAQLLQQIRQLIHERVRFAPIFKYISPALWVQGLQIQR